LTVEEILAEDLRRQPLAAEVDGLRRVAGSAGSGARGKSGGVGVQGLSNQIHLLVCEP
jgi:hypothetical protein